MVWLKFSFRLKNRSFKLKTVVLWLVSALDKFRRKHTRSFYWLDSSQFCHRRVNRCRRVRRRHFQGYFHRSKSPPGTPGAWCLPLPTRPVSFVASYIKLAVFKRIQTHRMFKYFSTIIKLTVAAATDFKAGGHTKKKKKKKKLHRKGWWRRALALNLSMVDRKASAGCT